MQKVTTDHHKIKAWAKKYNGQPALIDDPQAGSDKVGIRIDFPGKADEELLSNTQSTSWDHFFQQFEQQQLAFVYEEKRSNRDPTYLYRFIKRNEI